MPFDELLCEILLIVEAAHLEKGGLYETHQVLNGALLLRTMRPTQLHPDAQLEHDVSEDRIPFRDLAVSLPLEDRGLKVAEKRRGHGMESGLRLRHARAGRRGGIVLAS